jgi:hypothetical protein
MVGHRPNSTSGVVGVACEAFHLVRGHPIQATLWFCPNNVCHRSRARRTVSGLPPVPAVLPVQLGTALTSEEIEFLTSQGIDFEGQPTISGEALQACSLRIDLNRYPEKINFVNQTQRLPSQNGKRIRQRTFIIGKHLKRIEKAEQEEMTVVAEEIVLQGNAYGRRFRIRSHENDETLPTVDYWVQICCFPTCSCEDYFRHHGYSCSFLLCKHLYWVFKHIFCLDI